MRRLAAAVSIAAALAFVPAAAASGAAPEVEFDVPAVVAADDATTEAFRAARPGEKLLAMRMEFSSLVRRGDAADLTDVLYRVESVDRETFVVDYAPKTTFAPLASGAVAVERDADENASLAVNVKGRYLAFAEGDATYNKKSNEQTRLRYEMPAPQEVVVTSGTWRRRRGVFVKLRSSRRGSLEGAKAVVVLLAVPQNWRGGLLRVEAEARSAAGGVLGDGEAVVCGEASYLAGAYLTGDLVARDAVENLIAAEKALEGAQAERDGRRKKGFEEQVRGAFGELVALSSKKHRSRTEQREAELAAAFDEVRSKREAAADALAQMNASPRQ